VDARYSQERARGNFRGVMPMAFRDKRGNDPRYRFPLNPSGISS
jgi:hypothetical protein